jgi:hypothetical protein
MGAIGDFEEVPQLKDAFGSTMGGLYGWQNPWTMGGQTTLSRCREEKFDGLSERSSIYPHQDVLRRGFGLGGC